jgi:hypothetical protein
VVHLADSKEEGDHQFPGSQESAAAAADEGSPGEQGGIAGLLTFPTVPVRRSQQSSSEPLVDYSKSILLTSDAYLAQMEQMSAKCTNAAIAKDARKAASEEHKRKREEERILQIQRKKECEEDKAEKAREKAYWAEIAERGWGNDLQARMKSSLPPPPGSYRGVYVGSVPTWCITNQRQRRMLLDLRRVGASYGGGRVAHPEPMRFFEPRLLHGPAPTQGRP